MGKTFLAIIILLFTCSTKKQQIGVALFVENPTAFQYYLEGVGQISIVAARLQNNVLYTEYAYFMDGENRTGKSRHALKDNTVFTGNWETKSEKGRTIFSGESTLTFKSDGTATGEWSMEGEKSTYEIRIDRID